MFSKHWPGFIVAIAVAVLGSSAAHAQPMAVVADQDFGSVRVANAAASPATRTFDIRNGGTTPLTISSVTVSQHAGGRLHDHCRARQRDPDPAERGHPRLSKKPRS